MSGGAPAGRDDVVASSGGGWRVVDALVPRSSQRSVEELRRGRLFIISNLVLTAAALFFAVLAIDSDGTINLVAWMLFIGAGLCVCNLPLARNADSLDVPARLMCVEHIVIVWLCGFFGSGVGDPSQWWLAPAPLVAALLVGPRAGLFSAGLAAAGEVGLFVAERNGVHFEPRGADFAFFTMMGMTTVFGGIAALVWAYEQSRLKSVALVDITLVRITQTNDELSKMAAALTAARDAAVAENQKKNAFIDDMRRFSVTQTAALERSRQSTERLSSTIRSISSSVETLAKAAATSDGAIDGVVGASAEVGKTMGTMVAAVDETDSALKALRGAVDSVQAGFGALRQQATATATAMVSMEESAAAVEDNAIRTAALSSGVITDAVRGAEAMRRSVSGIEQIRSTAVVVNDAMTELLAQIEEVDRIMNVIDEVTVETNVLALNASIIAAQAGEQGRGFGVVAEQIKGLAARTATSTRASAEVIELVKGRARHAGGTLSQAISAVDAGLTLSRDAATALDQILRSATEAEAMARGIEKRTVEQVQQAEAVAAAMGKVMREVQRSADAAGDHSRTASQIDDAILRMKRLAPELARRADVQTDSSRAVRAAIAQVNAMAQQLAAVQGEQTRAAEVTFASADELHRAQQGVAAALASLMK